MHIDSYSGNSCVRAVQTMFLISHKQMLLYILIAVRDNKWTLISENFWLSKNLTSKRKKLNCEMI